MEELITLLQEILNNMQSNTWENVLTVVGIVVPILLTGISIYLTVSIDKRNTKLQKEIHNRDVRNQTRGMFLDIYNKFFDAYHITVSARGNISDIFTSHQSYIEWYKNISKIEVELNFAYNQSKLLLDDKNLLSNIKKILDAFSDIDSTVFNYIKTGIASQTIENAWKEFSLKNNIDKNRYDIFVFNPYLRMEFQKLCENDYTNEIEEKVNKFNYLMESDDFDNLFRNYVKITELQ